MRKFISIILTCVALSGYAQMYPEQNSAGKYGYKDKKTGKSIPFIYDYATDFENGKALVKKGSTHFVIDMQGKELVELPYRELSTTFAEGVYLYFEDTVAALIRSTGEVMSIIRFKEAYAASQAPGIFVVRDGKQIGFFSIYKGVILPLEYECHNFEYTFASVYGEKKRVYLESEDLIALKHKGKWGVVTPFGKITIPFVYDYLMPVEYSLKYNKQLGACKNGKCGVVTAWDTVIVPFEYDAFLGNFPKADSGSFIGSNACVFMKNDKVMFYDTWSGKIVSKVHPMKDGPWVAWYQEVKKFDKEGAIDNQGRIIVPIEYDKCSCIEGSSEYYANPRFNVCKDGKCALYRVGKGLITPWLECDQIYQYPYKGKTLSVLYKNKQCALYDENYKQLTDYKYDRLYADGEAIYVRIGEKNGKMSIGGDVTWD